MMVPELSDAPMQYGINAHEWTRTRQGQYQSPSVVRFTQRDIDNGYVWYSDQSLTNDKTRDESFEFMVRVYLNSSIIFSKKVIKKW